MGREGDEPAQTVCGRLPRGPLDQLGGLSFLAAPGREQHLGVCDRRVPGRLGDQAILFEHLRRRGQLAREDAGAGTEVESQAQVHERAGCASDLCLPSRQEMPSLGVQQLDGDRGARSGSGEREPAAGLVGAGVDCENRLECSAERRRSGRVSLGQADREPVEQDVHRPRRVGAGRRGARGLGCLERATGAVQVAGPDRGHERLQVCLAGQAGVEWLEAPGRAEKQPSRVAAALLLQRDLPAQLLHLRGAERVERAGLDRDQQAQCGVERAGVALRPGRRQPAPGPAGGLGRQRRRAFEERSRCGHAPARLRATR